PVLPPQWQPWTQFTLAAVTAMLLTARRGGRPVLARRLRPRDVPVDVVDLVAPDRSLVGCVDGDRVVTTAVELSAGALVDTGVGGRPRRRGVRGEGGPLVAPGGPLGGCGPGARVGPAAVELPAGAPVATGAGGDEPADFPGVRPPPAAIARQLDQGGVLLGGID